MYDIQTIYRCLDASCYLAVYPGKLDTRSCLPGLNFIIKDLITLGVNPNKC